MNDLHLFELKGKLNPGVVGKDVIIALCGKFNNDEVLNHVIEFTGDGIANLSVDQRLSIANMTTEWGALAGVFPIDDITIKWLENRTAKTNERMIEIVNFLIDKEKIRAAAVSAPAGLKVNVN